jgi:hypothetical protein
LLTGMSGISLHMQWPLTSQLHGSVSQREQLVFFVTDQNPRPYPTRSLHAKLGHQCTEWSTVWVSTKPLKTYLCSLQISRHFLSIKTASIMGCRCGSAEEWKYPKISDSLQQSGALSSLTPKQFDNFNLLTRLHT